MPLIEGITFDPTSHQLMSDLINRLKLTGACAVYGLPRMNIPIGELRIAHDGPNLQRRYGRGVFVRISPSPREAAVVIRPTGLVGGARRTELNANNADDVFNAVNSWRSQVRDPFKT